jgi:hypothetical protein
MDGLMGYLVEGSEGVVEECREDYGTVHLNADRSHYITVYILALRLNREEGRIEGQKHGTSV